MKVTDHTVAMNAQYFNVKFESTTAKVENSQKEFTNSESTKLHKLENNQKDIDRGHDALSKELSKALLQNINNQTNRVKRDRIEISFTQAEAQELRFSASALVKADGKEIALNLDVSLSRSFVQKDTVSFSIPKKLKDPLIINLDGKMPTLSSKTFSFDIDSDGKSDQISSLTQGNMFLALDKNSNGKVDNGSELFGAQSGDGFGDLAKYDSDKNGWIDENDPIFDKLRVWEGNGSDSKLIALGEVGIGAIFLGDIQTPFSLKDNSNALLGEIKSSSFVLFENGKAGVISQVDLALEDETKEGLENFKTLSKEISTTDLREIYFGEESGSLENAKGELNSDKIERLQAQIKALEQEIVKADEENKPPLQAELGNLYSQMMSLIEQSL